MPDETNPQTTAARQQIELLESEKKQIEQRRQKDAARLAVIEAQLTALRTKHGQDLEDWWIDRFGHTFDCLTQSEARYLERTKNADTVRDRIIAAEQARDG